MLFIVIGIFGRGIDYEFSRVQASIKAGPRYLGRGIRRSDLTE
jgi:hypothetical protein